MHLTSVTKLDAFWNVINKSLTSNLQLSAMHCFQYIFLFKRSLSTYVNDQL